MLENILYIHFNKIIKGREAIVMIKDQDILYINHGNIIIRGCGKSTPHPKNDWSKKNGLPTAKKGCIKECLNKIGDYTINPHLTTKARATQTLFVSRCSGGVTFLEGELTDNPLRETGTHPLSFLLLLLSIDFSFTLISSRNVVV